MMKIVKKSLSTKYIILLLMFFVSIDLITKTIAQYTVGFYIVEGHIMRKII